MVNLKVRYRNIQGVSKKSRIVKKIMRIMIILLSSSNQVENIFEMLEPRTANVGG